MKKFITLLLVLSMVLSTVVMPTFAAESGASSDASGYTTEISVLKTLGIAAEDVNLSAKVTRKEFAEYLGKAYSLGDVKTTSRYFNDVEDDSIINVLVELGVFKGTEERTFDPDSEIELTHAMAAIIRSLGYIYTGTGDSLAEFLNIAKRLDIDDDVVWDDGATNLNILLMMYNTLMVSGDMSKVYLSRNVDWTNGVKYPKNGKTLMETVFDAYLLEDAIVTETYLTSLGGAGNISKDKIKIGNKIYKCEISDAVDYIGMHVNALVSEKNSEAEILYIEANDKENETIEIDAGNFVSFDDYTIKYFDESDKEREIKFETSMSVIYNGVAESKNLSTFFDIKEGSIKCVKGSKDKYSVAIIEGIENVRVAKAVSLNDMLVYTESVAPYNCIDFTKRDDVYRKVFLASNGEDIGATVLVPKDILSVVRSSNGKYVKAYLCTETATGELKSISSGSDTIYTIDDKEYKAAPGFDPLAKNHLGDNVSFILDVKGKLAAVSDSSTTGDRTIGYMYQMAVEEGFESQVRLKIYTQNKEHKVFECADKVKIDGVTYNETEVPSAIGDGSGGLKRNIVMFRTNNDGELVYIDTPAADKSQREGGNTLWKFEDEGSFKYDDTNKMFYPKYPLWYDTYIFCIPNDDDMYPEELSFDVYMDRVGPFIRKTDYKVGMYKFDDDTPFMDVVTYRRGDKYTATIHEMDRAMLVDSIKSVYEADGTTVTVLCGVESSVYKEYRVEPGVDVSNVGEGDIIRTGRNGRGYVGIAPEILYDYSEGKTSWTGFASKSYDTNGRFVMGYLSDIYYYNEGGTNNGKMSAASLSQTLGGSVEELFLIDTNPNNFTIYDSSRREYKAYVGSVTDAIPYDFGTGKASKVFIHVNSTNVVSVIIYI